MTQTINNNLNYTEDWLPVKQIMNGMIQLDDGTYVTGVKITPKNIFIWMLVVKIIQFII